MGQKNQGYGRHSVIPFGKHCGETIEEVIDNDPSYITWAINNELIHLNNEAYEIYDGAVNRAG